MLTEIERKNVYSFLDNVFPYHKFKSYYIDNGYAFCISDEYVVCFNEERMFLLKNNAEIFSISINSVEDVCNNIDELLQHTDVKLVCFC